MRSSRSWVRGFVVLCYLASCTCTTACPWAYCAAVDLTVDAKAVAGDGGVMEGKYLRYEVSGYIRIGYACMVLWFGLADITINFLL